MMPFYPLNQHPAIDSYERDTRPASRLEIQRQFLVDERQRYAAFQGDAHRHAATPVMAVAHVVHQAIASLSAVTRHLMPRHAAPAPGSHICVPGVDC